VYCKKNTLFALKGQQFINTMDNMIISGVGAVSFKFLMEQYNLDIDLTGYLIGK
jgi:hypothetical protein